MSVFWPVMQARERCARKSNCSLDFYDSYFVIITFIYARSYFVDEKMATEESTIAPPTLFAETVIFTTALPERDANEEKHKQ